MGLRRSFKTEFPSTHTCSLALIPEVYQGYLGSEFNNIFHLISRILMTNIKIFINTIIPICPFDQCPDPIYDGQDPVVVPQE